MQELLALLDMKAENDQERIKDGGGDRQIEEMTAYKAAKLLRECRDLMQSLVDADGGVASDAELEKHVAWAKELLA